MSDLTFCATVAAVIVGNIIFRIVTDLFDGILGDGGDEK